MFSAFTSRSTISATVVGIAPDRAAYIVATAGTEMNEQAP